MTRLVRLLTSSIGRKMLMGATGLLLLAFLVVHVSGNLLLFAGPRTFNAYSHGLVTNPLVYVAEVGLLILFVAHFASGLLITRANQVARPVAYAMKRRAGGASHKSLASTTMILTGLVVLAFVPLHLWTFKYGPHYAAASDPAVRDLHRLVLEVFSRPLEVAWYVAAMVIIGFHLWHGFGSGLESLGLPYQRGLRMVGQFLAVAITVGFVVVPIAVYFGGVR
jgi:succinate dehydrogenase / fumarate reductase, cytochrome b subunit